MRLPFALFICLLACATVCCNKAGGAVNNNPPPAPAVNRNKRGLPLAQVKLPPGFSIALYAEDVPAAREMSLSPSGVLYVGSNNAGKVYAVVDSNHDYYADDVITLGSNLSTPVGVAFHGGDLYYSEISAVWKLPGVEAHLGQPVTRVKVADFPDKQHHGWKFIAIGPDNRLYVPVGVPCNVCNDGDPFGCILRMNLDGSGREVIARGMRNTVGFDWHPSTGELWWTDNGRDELGDDVPPDELNRIPAGSGADATAPHFGFPFWHGHDIADPDFKDLAKDKYIKPAQDLAPHVAALGMEFYRGKMFPAEYRNQIFIAEHGSWNRSKKIGYRISLVKNDGEKSLGYNTFADGWKQGETVWGRPDDVEEMPDGSLLISDDYAGCIYRITYKTPGS